MIEQIYEKSVYKDGSVLAVLMSDTSSELVGVTATGGKPLHFGSFAIIAKEGEVCLFDSDGKWHKSDGTEVTADE